LEVKVFFTWKHVRQGTDETYDTGTAGCLYYMKEHNSFLDRSLKFWTRAFPILVHYRYADFKSRMLNQSEDDRDAMFNQMHHQYADELLATILELRGFYVKIGQNMATRADILPPIWIERLRTLEDQGCFCHFFTLPLRGIRPAATASPASECGTIHSPAEAGGGNQAHRLPVPRPSLGRGER
jgi:hypothetical protein